MKIYRRPRDVGRYSLKSQFGCHISFFVQSFKKRRKKEGKWKAIDPDRIHLEVLVSDVVGC